MCEFNVMMEAHNEKTIKENDNRVQLAIINAYYTESLSRCQKLPKLETLLKDNKTSDKEARNNKEADKEANQEIPLEYYIKLACMKGLQPPISVKNINKNGKEVDNNG